MVIEINRLSLNSDGAFRTMMHKRMPHKRNKNSTANRNDERLGPEEGKERKRERKNESWIKSFVT